MPTIRTARPDDAASIHAIYAPIVRDTSISFELEPPTVDEMRRRIASTSAGLPWLVGVDDADAVLGYVYAGKHRGSLNVASFWKKYDGRRMVAGRFICSIMRSTACLAVKCETSVNSALRVTDR